MKIVDIVCPVFREEEGIGAFHRRLSNVLHPLGKYEFRILYVLDPFPDRTEEALAEIARTDQRVEVLVMSRRFGHQAALLAGIEASEADAVITLDSDLQHPPELIPDLLKRWEEGAEIVQGVRVDGTETRLLKRLTSRWFYRLFLRAADFGIETGAAEYRLLSRRVVDALTSGFRERNVFLRGLVGWVGFRIEHVPFRPETRHAGRSSYNVLTLVSFAVTGICSFSKLPLRLCVVAGIALAVLSVIAGALQVLAYLVGTVEVPGWASLFALVSFIGGIQLFFLGVVGEYLGLIFDEVKARPRYIISHAYRADDDPGHRAPLERGRASLARAIAKADAS